MFKPVLNVKAWLRVRSSSPTQATICLCIIMNAYKHVSGANQTARKHQALTQVTFTSPNAEAELRAVEVHHIVPQKPVQDIDHHWLEHHLRVLLTHTSACFPSPAIRGPPGNVVVFTERPASWNKHHWKDWEVLPWAHSSAFPALHCPLLLTSCAVTPASVTCASWANHVRTCWVLVGKQEVV